MDLRAIIKNAYRKDTICVKTIAQLDAYLRFGIWEGLIWTKNQLKRDVICIPQDAFQRTSPSTMPKGVLAVMNTSTTCLGLRALGKSIYSVSTLRTLYRAPGLCL